MRRQSVILAMVLCLQILWAGCDLGDSPRPDPQFVKIQFEYGFGDLVDTFTGQLTKDLVLDGTVSIPFWLTTAEQEAVLAELEREHFFDLPDTLFQAPGSIIDPDPSPDMLRVQVSGRDKIVIWYYPLLLTNANAETIQHLSATIRGLVEAKAEYKRLPPARGGRI